MSKKRSFITIFVLSALSLVISACDSKPLSKQECDILYQCISIELIDADNKNRGQSGLALPDSITRLLDPEKAKQQETLEFIFTELKEFERITHPDRPNGMARVNTRLVSGEWLSINPALFSITKAAKELYTSSNGYFNPALGKVITLWGFHKDPKQAEGKQLPDSKAILEILKQNPAMDHIEFDGIRVRSSNPAVSMQFGLLYQGYIVRLVRSMLYEAGIKQAVILTNNTVSTHGTTGEYRDQQHNRYYRLGTNETLCHANVRDHYFLKDGRPYHVYLDIDTGFPAATIDHVVVIHGSEMTATAGCQALMASDGREWEITANMMKLEAVELAWRNNTAAVSSIMEERRQTPAAP